jgi:hypothetical protein
MLVFQHPQLEEGKVSIRLPGIHKPSQLPHRGQTAGREGPGIPSFLDPFKKK